jgi:hypothetical protein
MYPQFPLLQRKCRNRGVASVEAVIVIPFLILIYFGVVLVHARYDAQQRAWSSARGCAWLYSQRGCKGELPAECGAAVSGPAELPENEELDEAARGDEVQADDEDSQKVVDKKNLLLGEPRSSLFGEYVTVTASVDFQSPALFGEGRSASAPYYVACNLEEQTLGDIARQFVDAVYP